MSTTHWFLQSKGGVGKSLAGCFLAQYLPDTSINVRCYDADPIFFRLHLDSALMRHVNCSRDSPRWDSRKRR